jgi:MFS family permease
MQYRRWVIFGICTTLFLMSLFYRASGAVIASDLSRDLHLDPEGLGILGAAFFYAFALVQVPLGIVLDRVGPKRTMILLNLVAMAGGLVFAQAESVTGGVVGRSLLGIGMSANLMGTFVLLTRWFEPARFATLSGLVLGLGTLGSLAATSPLALLVDFLGWRGSFYALAGLNGLLVLGFLFIVRDDPEVSEQPHRMVAQARMRTSPLRPLRNLFRTWSYWAISWSIFLRYGSYASIQALWAGPFLMEYLGLPTLTAGNLLLLMSFGFILGSPAGGMVSSRLLHSRKRAIILASFIAGLAIFLVSRWDQPVMVPALGAVFFVLGFFAAFNQVSYAHIKELMPQEMSGTAMTGINFFTMVGAGVFIHGLGELIKHTAGNLSRHTGTYELAFLVCSGAFLLNLVLYITTRDSSGGRPIVPRSR